MLLSPSQRTALELLVLVAVALAAAALLGLLAYVAVVTRSPWALLVLAVVVAAIVVAYLRLVEDRAGDL